MPVSSSSLEAEMVAQTETTGFYAQKADKQKKSAH